MASLINLLSLHTKLAFEQSTLFNLFRTKPQNYITLAPSDEERGSSSPFIYSCLWSTVANVSFKRIISAASTMSAFTCLFLLSYRF